jgi:hypothetical protein
MPHIHDLGLPAPDGTHSRAGQADATSPVPAAPLPPPDQTRTPETHGYSVLPGHLLTASMPSVQDALPRGVRGAQNRAHGRDSSAPHGCLGGHCTPAIGRPTR